MSERCADVSAADGEPLGGTGIVAERWLLVESRRAWGRDAIESGFPEEVARWLGALDAKVLAIRRPGRRPGVTVFAATTGEGQQSLRRLVLDDVAELPGTDPWTGGDALAEPLYLACTHGRRDACCSRLGLPVFRVLDNLVGSDRAWQCSHTGGHRFAANVVVLPSGVTLGRVPPDDVGALVALLHAGRVPLASYRGRSTYDPPVQAAEVAIRRAHGFDRLDDLRLVGATGAFVRFSTPRGDVTATVEEVALAPRPKSCGAEPEPISAFRTRLS